MKKKVILSSILLSGLVIYSGCTPKVTEIIPAPAVQERQETVSIETQPAVVIPVAPSTTTITEPEPVEITTPLPVPSREREPVVQENNVLQLPSIQGDVIQVEKRKTGFLFPQYKNKIILLEIFGQDCEYCMEELPVINELHTKYANQLQVIAIQAQEPMSKEVSSRLIRQFNMNYPIIEKAEGIDLLLFLRETYNWTGILPYVLLIKDGVTEFALSGEETDKEQLEGFIQKLL